MPQIKFTYSRAGCDRRHYLSADDVLAVLNRLPADARSNLRTVHFNDRSWGTRLLGYANSQQREISICALPPRVSLTRFLRGKQTPEMFGAERGRQWPEVVVRRFLLYDVLLHELGHLQIIVPEAKSERRKYAGERAAQEFADRWREWLWAQPLIDVDPVHRSPVLE